MCASVSRGGRALRRVAARQPAGTRVDGPAARRVRGARAPRNATRGPGGAPRLRRPHLDPLRRLGRRCDPVLAVLGPVLEDLLGGQPILDLDGPLLLELRDRQVVLVVGDVLELLGRGAVRRRLLVAVRGHPRRTPAPPPASKASAAPRVPRACAPLPISLPRPRTAVSLVVAHGARLHPPSLGGRPPPPQPHPPTAPHGRLATQRSAQLCAVVMIRGGAPEVPRERESGSTCPTTGGVPPVQPRVARLTSTSMCRTRQLGATHATVKQAGAIQAGALWQDPGKTHLAGPRSLPPEASPPRRERGGA